MYIGSCKIHLRCEWVSSLKEKRAVVKHIVERARHKFNISIAEVGKMDVHTEIEIGFCLVCNDGVLTEKILHNVLNFIEENTDAVVNDVEIEILK